MLIFFRMKLLMNMLILLFIFNFTGFKFMYSDSMSL